MTFQVGRNQVHIGWWQAGIIVLGLITSTWSFEAAVNRFEDNQHAADYKLVQMERLIINKNKKDSLQDIKMDSLHTMATTAMQEAKDAKQLVTALAAKHLVTYRWINGHLAFAPADKN